MKIAVLGGGPAGLYFSVAVKQLMPNVSIDVFESRNESIHSYGLGYTLQTLGSDLLKRIDPDFFSNMFSDERPMIITKALFKTTYESRCLDFTEGFSVTRSTLMKYLLAQVGDLGIQVNQSVFDQSWLSQHSADYDLIIGADGVNSVVRQSFPEKFGASSHPAKLNYSWFTNETKQTRKEACFYAFEAEEGIVTLTSYPLNDHKQVVVIEMSDVCFNAGKFKNSSPEEVQNYLSEILSVNGDVFDLKAAGTPWYSFVMNVVNSPVYNNYALIGDAAYAFHYGLGQGVSTAFTMGYVLANCLSKTDSIPAALERYAAAINMSLQAPAKTSYESIRWLEDIESHFEGASKEQQLEMLRLKHQFN